MSRYMDKKLQIKLNANRMVIGTLRGFDQFMNLVVDNTVEVNGNEKNDIGMVVIRGNSVVTVEALEPVAKNMQRFMSKCTCIGSLEYQFIDLLNGGIICLTELRNWATGS
ncbi:probable small nuclear ribonucleoprotein G, partial [Prunus dulcis]